ncbi:hypothetical protein F503_06342 [Ophiostoma piceae UAMH 11346]|uniref:Uncharacterized protein n=1 Tax=Ophiostoma piceae (strain UAMH 11346) TaxID=1262450 RepID=S3CES1_OPHP1|nr:hypothetical protein F503_06342 [Ophiostoma piceae UAMH 11346]
MARLSLAVLATLFSSSLVAAAPTETPVHTFFRRDTSAAALIAKVMPGTLTCTNTVADTGCVNNTYAAKFFIDAFDTYNIRTSAEIAGVLALTSLESGDLSFRSRSDSPGQGTSNMQSPGFNLDYARSFPELAAAANASVSDVTAVLALVTPDKYNFASGAWFLATQCSDAIRAQLQTGTDAGFAAYMSCVGVTVTDSRQAHWVTAQKAFGLI